MLYRQRPRSELGTVEGTEEMKDKVEVSPLEDTDAPRDFSIALTQELSNKFCAIIKENSPMFGEALLALLASADAVLRASQDVSGGHDDFEREVRAMLGDISRGVLQNAAVSREEVLEYARKLRAEKELN